MVPRLRSFAPQFLVDDLARSIAYDRDVPGFEFSERWGGFYVIGSRDGFDVHLKETWGTKDFYVEDPNGYILSFGGTDGPRESSS